MNETETTVEMEALRRSNEELQQFAYIASHDLQEPLRVITSYLRLLSRREGDRLDPESQRFLEQAVEGADRMKCLIQGLLEYSRIGSQGGDFRQIALADVVEDACTNLALAIRESGGSVEVPHPLPMVVADRGQLVQLLQNLFGNSLKFRGEEPPVVRVTAEDRGSEWLVSVSDNGVGVPEGQRERIFEMFQRLHTMDSKQGYGIGLAICRRIVSRHRGVIDVAQSASGGADFRFTLSKIIP